jgi:hypothetical protein
VPGTILRWIALDGSQGQNGQPMLLVDPSPELVWESLRALYLVGEKDDLANVSHCARGIEGMPPQVQQQQAVFTARAISSRAIR